MEWLILETLVAENQAWVAAGLVLFLLIGHAVIQVWLWLK